MGILRRDKKKEERIIAINFNATPRSLLFTLRFMILALFLVAWINILLTMLLYILGLSSMLVLLFAGLDLKKRDLSFGRWFIPSLLLTLLFGGFMFSNNVIAFVVGAYLTGLFANIIPCRFLEKLLEDEEYAEVLNRGYYEGSS